MATANIVLRRKLCTGEYRIAIRYSHLNNPSNYINLPYTCFKDCWLRDLQRFDITVKKHKTLNRAIAKIEERLEEALTELNAIQDFQFSAFRRIYLKEKDNRTVKEMFSDKLEELKNTNRQGSYITYSCCLSSLEKFTSLDIRFESINYKFLSDFEKYHKKLGNKNNTIGNYLRSLRALHYEYCKLNDLPEPTVYKRFNVARFRNESEKKSLTVSNLKKLIDHQPNTRPKERAKMVFLFSFYTRGMNLLDMLQLTKANIVGNSISYVRSKTKKHIHVLQTEEANTILEYFENDSGYLFPYLRPEDNIKDRTRSINRYINEQLELICKDIEIPKITFYSARHTFAELQYKAGIRIEIISQMLGHSDLKTTQTYLRSFSDDEVNDAAAKVFDSLK